MKKKENPGREGGRAIVKEYSIKDVEFHPENLQRNVPTK